MLFLTAIAPSIALLYYFYKRDKYEKEPRRLLARAFFIGCISVIPVVIVEMQLNLFERPGDNFITAGYTAFIVAGLVEESFKYLAFYFYIWRHTEFDEMYDGIVYCVFISLGFATVENIGYVVGSGFSTALVRAMTAIPAHALFGVVMGYYLGIAKFISLNVRAKYMKLGFFIPILLHGVYDFILFSQKFYLLVIFIPYMLYLWRRGLRHVDELVEASPYKSEK